ncbi:hypothetical protein P7H50_05675 [Enterococcus durans]|uniref:hypothetical protein n=1 Tax=Enterococcus durans TaxID=53345 RepID=UPI00289208EB|nr:hypothetical protein [Enterococcus durans]MDT2836378.1 hypothetical protein [Enterococcus durans]
MKTPKKKLAVEVAEDSWSQVKTSELGEVFDPLAGITVHDREEKLLPEIEVSGTFNSTLPGTYLVHLSVRDSFERVTTSYQLNVLATEENMETGE